MAKIRLKFGENEVEIESRDFYIDNTTLGDVINSVTRSLQANKARVVFDDRSLQEFDQLAPSYEATKHTLESLDDAEIHEPEFNEPTPISAGEIRNKLLILEKNSFFNQPRTVSETVEQLREYGWLASPLEVSKILTKMAFVGEISKDSKNNRTCFSAKAVIVR